MTSQREFYSHPRFAGACLVAAVALAYANSLHAPFLFDDAGAVVGNPTIRHLGSLDVLRPPADGSTTTGRPLVNLSFALNYAVSGEQVWSYHVVNIAIHAAASLLLFGVVRRTLVSLTSQRPPLNSQLSPLNSEPSTLNRSRAAFFAALLWALHPLQTESVVCIAQRTETLCGFFYLLTLYGFVRAVVPLEGGARCPQRAWFIVSAAACLVGMATKEVMVTAPLVVFLFDRTFVAGTFSAAWRARRGYYLVLAATWLLLLLLLTQGGGSRGIAAGFGLGVSWWSYLLKQCEALVRYLQLAVWPHPLVLDYGTAVVRSPFEVWWQLVVVFALLSGTTWALVRRPVLGFVGAWFFLILAPSSSIVPLVTQTMAEHRMYLPLASLMVGLVVMLHMRWPGATRFALPAVAIVLGVTTHARNRDYRDSFTIWSASVADYPQSARAHNNLALVLQQRGDVANAHAHFSRAVELDPAYATAHYNWGVALLGEGRLDEALVHFESALRFAPNHTDALVNLGSTLVRLRRPADAISSYERALRLKPAADVHYNLGIALAEVGRGEAAAIHFQSALQLNPRLAEAHFQLGRLYERDHRVAEAEAHYLAALQVAPGHAAAHARLGVLYARSDRLDAAARHLLDAARLNPNDADVRANLGNVLLLQGHPRDALDQYEAALRLRPDDSRLRESIRAARDALR